MPWYTVTFPQLCLTAFGLLLIAVLASRRTVAQRHDSPDASEGDYPVMSPEFGWDLGIEHDPSGDRLADHDEPGRHTLH